MVKPVNRTTKEQYEGAEKLAEKIVQYINFELAKKPAVKDFTINTVKNLCFDQLKSVVRCELYSLLLEVDEELNDQQEYFRSGKPLEI